MYTYEHTSKSHRRKAALLHPQSCSRQPLLPSAVVQLVTMTSNVTIDVTLTFLPFPE